MFPEPVYFVVVETHFNGSGPSRYRILASIACTTQDIDKLYREYIAPAYSTGRSISYMLFTREVASSIQNMSREPIPTPAQHVYTPRSDNIAQLRPVVTNDNNTVPLEPNDYVDELTREYEDKIRGL